MTASCHNHLRSKRYRWIGPSAPGVRPNLQVHTAKSTGRPGYKALLAFLTAHPDVRTVVVLRIDRLVRNHYEYGLLVEQMDVEVHSVVETAPPTATGRLVHGMSVVVAKYHSDNLAAEIKTRIRGKFEGGGCVTKAPVGYLNISRTRTKPARVEIDPEKGPVVVRAFERYATGDVSLASLAEELFELGVRTRAGRVFSAETVRWVLSHPFYKGLVRYGDEVRQGTHEPLVTVELWDRVQATLKARHRRPGERGRRFFLLRGLLQCEECDRPLTAEVHPRGAYYRCCPFPRRACGARYRPVPDLDAEVEALLASTGLAPGALPEMEAAICEVESERTQRRQRDEQRLRTELAKDEANLIVLTEKYVTGSVPEEAYRHVYSQWTATRARVRAELAALTGDISADLAELRDAITTASGLAKLYGRLKKPESRKTFLQKVFRRITVRDQHIVHLEYNQPFDLLFGDTPRGDSKNDLVQKLVGQFIARRAEEATCSKTAQ